MVYRMFKMYLAFATKEPEQPDQELLKKLLIYPGILRLKLISSLCSGVDFQIKPKFNNVNGLSSVYNSVISEVQNEIDAEKDSGCIIFVHDDVAIQDLYFFEKIIEYHKEFDVIGVAGSTQLNSKSDKIAWHISNPSCHRGAVMHNTKEKNVFYINSFGSMPSRVCVIDGLFISVSFNSLYNRHLRFDEDFSFDFYDAALCANAILFDLKIGVIPLSIYHGSHGDGILAEKYDVESKKFCEKYITLLKNHKILL